MVESSSKSLFTCFDDEQTPLVPVQPIIAYAEVVQIEEQQQQQPLFPSQTSSSSSSQYQVVHQQQQEQQDPSLLHGAVVVDDGNNNRLMEHVSETTTTTVTTRHCVLQNYQSVPTNTGNEENVSTTDALTNSLVSNDTSSGIGSNLTYTNVPSSPSSSDDDGDERQKAKIVASGVASATLGLLLCGPIGAILFGLGGAYAAEKKQPEEGEGNNHTNNNNNNNSTFVGDTARALGEVALLAAEKAKQINNKHHVAEQTKTIAANAVRKLKEKIDANEYYPIIDKSEKVLLTTWYTTIDIIHQYHLMERSIHSVGKSVCWVLEKVTNKVLTNNNNNNNNNNDTSKNTNNNNNYDTNKNTNNNNNNSNSESLLYSHPHDNNNNRYFPTPSAPIMSFDEDHYSDNNNNNNNNNDKNTTLLRTDVLLPPSFQGTAPIIDRDFTSRGDDGTTTGVYIRT